MEPSENSEQENGEEDYEMTLENNYRNGFAKYTNQVPGMYSGPSDDNENAQSKEFLIQDQSDEPEIKSDSQRNEPHYDEL